MLYFAALYCISLNLLHFAAFDYIVLHCAAFHSIFMNWLYLAAFFCELVFCCFVLYLAAFCCILLHSAAFCIHLHFIAFSCIHFAAPCCTFCVLCIQFHAFLDTDGSHLSIGAACEHWKSTGMAIEEHLMNFYRLRHFVIPYIPLHFVYCYKNRFYIQHIVYYHLFLYVVHYRV